MMMTEIKKPTPVKYTDELITHLASCPQCKRARQKRRGSHCDIAKKLLEQTLKERHG